MRGELKSSESGVSVSEDNQFLPGSIVHFRGRKRLQYTVASLLWPGQDRLWPRKSWPAPAVPQVLQAEVLVSSEPSGRDAICKKPISICPVDSNA